MWEEVPLPGEVVQISCGPGDLLWAVLWEGQLIVREGIGRDCPKGEQPQQQWMKEDLYIMLFIGNIFYVVLRNVVDCGGFSKS